MDYVLRTQCLTKQFGEKTAVKNVSMQIKKGEIYGFIGKNGAGKTTLMRLILGAAMPTGGSIELFGGKENENEARHRIGALLEYPCIYKNCTALENLRRFAILTGADADELEDILELVGLKGVGRKKAGQFSLGMKQRLAIGIALLGHPEFLVLDEPINGLDPAGIKEIRDVILTLNQKKGVTFLVSSHLLDELSDEEVGDMVRRWRKASPAIVALWRAVEDAARSVVENGGAVQTHGLTFAAEYSRERNLDFLTIRLPSGRKLYYADPHFEPGKLQEQLCYFGQTMAKKWTSIPTYGGRLTENIVQAIARDCLAEAIERLEDAGLPVVFHIHDEVVIDVAPWDTEDAMLKKVVAMLSQRPAWAPDLPLTADGWVGKYFRKD